MTKRTRNQWRLNVVHVALGGFFLLLLVTFVLLWFKGGNQRMAITILIFKIAGLGPCVILVLGELGHPLFDRICPGDDEEDKLNCSAVMKSPAARLFGLIPMADIGAVYFSGGIILICFSSVHPHFFHSIFLLALLNLLTLPYTIFSVVYQAAVVKRWCAFCLIIQLLFWLELWQFYPFLAAGVPRFTVDHFFPFAWSFGLPALLWFLFRPWVKKAIETDRHD